MHLLLLLSVGLLLYCSHVAYCTTLRCSNSHHQSSPRHPGSQRWSYVQTLFLDVLTFTTSRLPRDPSSQRWNYVDEKWLMNFAWKCPTSMQHSGIFYMPQIYDMGQTALLPLQRRCAEDFFALKNPTASAANPRTWVPKASTLPLDHWSCFTMHLDNITFHFYQQMHLLLNI